MLSEPSNMPLHWLQSPTSENIENFSEKISTYEKDAKYARKLLLNKWMKEVKQECKKCIGPVEKLSQVRVSRENVWPCCHCSNLGIIQAWFLLYSSATKKQIILDSYSKSII